MTLQLVQPVPGTCGSPSPSSASAFRSMCSKVYGKATPADEDGVCKNYFHYLLTIE